MVYIPNKKDDTEKHQIAYRISHVFFQSIENTIQYNTILYNTMQYNTIQYNTIQYNTT